MKRLVLILALACPWFASQSWAADSTLPTITLTSPLAGATLSGTAAVVSANASDNVAIKQVVFYRDNWVLIKSVSVSPYRATFDSTKLVNGTHKFFAVAYDTSNNAKATAMVSANVSNTVVSPTPTPTPAPSPSPTPTPTPSPTPSPTATPTPTPSPTPVTVGVTEALKMADFILKLQDAGGAIKDSPGGTICNEDSNMEYALLGLAAAYVRTHDVKYLTGFEKGIAWLADREDMSTTEWRGSWYYTYSCSYPYAHVATSPGSGVTDVRGVDTTSAYFAYLVYIHSRITQSDSMVLKYGEHARSALEFVIRKNLTSEGLSASSYQLINGVWKLWPYQYTADQADVYLGFRAGGLLFDGIDRRYGSVADNLQQKIPSLFYDSQAGRYAEGREGGGLDWSNEFDAVFPQGYVAWVLGPNAQDAGAYQWLASKVQSSGALICYTNDPGYSLSAAEFIMAANALSKPSPASTINWLVTVPFDSQTGGVKDSSKDNTQYSNVTAFSILALLKQGAMGW